MLANPHLQIEGVIEYLGIDTPRFPVDQIIEETSAKAMRSRIGEHVRTATTGEAQKVLSPESLALIKSQYES